MNFRHRRTVDDAFDIHPEAHTASVDSSDNRPGRYQPNATSSGHPVTIEDALKRDSWGSAQGAGAGSDERVGVGEMDQANAASPSMNGPVPTDDSPMNLSSLRQPRIPVSCDFELMAQN